MDTHRRPPRLPNIKFRVLIIGRANAGKTSILQRVCDTTESPLIYRRSGFQQERIQLDPSMERGEHRIEDEIVFSNHDGYIFHDSRGFESGGEDELEIVRNFIRQKSGEKRLASRLHAIWYCIPMDNQRPILDLKHFKGICPDRNVPVIGVFTKYDQFKLNVEMDLEDDPDRLGCATPERLFQEHYLCHLGEGARFVRLERMHKPDGCCKNLIEETAAALNVDVVSLMLVAVQRSNLELSVTRAVDRVRPQFGSDIKGIVRNCLRPFPYIWISINIIDAIDEDAEAAIDDFMAHIMSMTIIRRFSSGNSSHHLMIAVIIVLMHATTLLHSSLLAKSALAQAELDYQKLNIGFKIVQHFTASPQEYSVRDCVDFIMGVSL